MPTIRSFLIAFSFLLSTSVFALPPAMEAVKGDFPKLLQVFLESNARDQLMALEEFAVSEKRWQETNGFPGQPQVALLRLEALELCYLALSSPNPKVYAKAMEILGAPHVTTLERDLYEVIKKATSRVISGAGTDSPFAEYVFVLHAIKGAAGTESAFRDTFASTKYDVSDRIRVARAVATVVAIHVEQDAAKVAEYRKRLVPMIGDPNATVSRIATNEVRYLYPKTSVPKEQLVAVPADLVIAISDRMDSMSDDDKIHAMEVLGEVMRTPFAIATERMTEAHFAGAMVVQHYLSVGNSFDIQVAAAKLQKNILVSDPDVVKALVAANSTTEKKLYEPAGSAIMNGIFDTAALRLALINGIANSGFEALDWSTIERISKHVRFKLEKSPRYASVYIRMLNARLALHRRPVTAEDAELKKKALSHFDFALRSYESSRGLLSDKKEDLQGAALDSAKAELKELFTSDVAIVKAGAAIQLVKLGVTDSDIVAAAVPTSATEDENADQAEAEQQEQVEEESPETDSDTVSVAETASNQDPKFSRQKAMLGTLRRNKVARNDAGAEAAMANLEKFRRIYLETVQGSPRYLTIYLRLVKILNGYEEGIAANPKAENLDRLKKAHDSLSKIVFAAGVNAHRMLLSYPKDDDFKTVRSLEVATSRRTIRHIVSSGQPDATIGAILALRFLSPSKMTIEHLDEVLSDRATLVRRRELFLRAMFTVLTRYTKTGNHKAAAREVINRHSEILSDIKPLAEVEVAPQETLSEEPVAVAPVSNVGISSTATLSDEQLSLLMKLFMQSNEIVSAINAGEYLLRASRHEPLPADLVVQAMGKIRTGSETVRRQAMEILLNSLQVYLNVDGTPNFAHPHFPILAELVREPVKLAGGDQAIELALSSIYDVLFTRKQTAAEILTRFEDSCLNDLLDEAKHLK